MPSAATVSPTARALDVAARLVAAAGLAVDAYVHAKLAGQYDAVTADISQGALFRVEAGLASLAALLVLVWRRPLSAALGWLVAAGGLAALLVYRYVNVGAHGPLPDMYEPVWTPDKRLTVWSQAAATAACSYLLLRWALARRSSDARDLPEEP